MSRFASPKFGIPALNLEQRFTADQTLHKLQSAMQRLRPRTRRRMDLCYKKLLSLKDAAETLGISVATGKIRVLRARRMLCRSCCSFGRSQ